MGYARTGSNPVHSGLFAFYFHTITVGLQDITTLFNQLDEFSYKFKLEMGYFLIATICGNFYIATSP